MTDTNHPKEINPNASPAEHSSPDSWQCPNCKQASVGNYCSNCGEKKLDPHDLTIAHFLESVFESFFHADGRFLSSLRTLLFRPGELTLAFVSGIRKKYIGPVQLFLLINLIYFLIQSVTGWNTFSTPLNTHVTDLAYRNFADAILNHHLEVTNVSYEEYEKVFNHSVRLHAKSLVIVMIPLFMLPVTLFYFGRRRSLVSHLTFATHFIAFELIFLCLMQPVASLILYLLAQFDVHPHWQVTDNVITLIGMVVQLVYLIFAARRVYNQSWWLVIPKSLLLVYCYSYVVPDSGLSSSW